MPRTTDPSKYPDHFWQLLVAVEGGPVVIPKETDAGTPPAGLRGYIQAFLRAVEANGEELDKQRAKAIQVTAHVGDPDSTDPAKRGPHVVVCKRSDSVYGQAIARALGSSPQDAVAAAAAALSESLAKLPSTTPA